MSKERIQALISSETDENEIASELIKYFTENPELLNERYVLERNVFHLLVFKNKNQTLKLLLKHIELEKKPWLDTAILPDRVGSTLLHYAARSENDLFDTMQILLKYLHRLISDQTKLGLVINHQNKLGQTALHEAVSAQNLLTAKQLVASSLCDRSISDINGYTVLQMPELNHELREAILSIDLTTIKSLDLRLRKKPLKPWRKNSEGSSGDSFRGTFPLLSSGGSPSECLASSSSSLESLRSSLRRYPSELNSPGASSSDLSRSAEKEQEEKEPVEKVPVEKEHSENNVIASEVVILKIRHLIKAYQTSGQSVVTASFAASLLTDFTTLLQQHSLASDFDLSKEQVLKSLEGKQILLNIIDALPPKVDELYTQTQDMYYRLIDRLIHMISPHISIADSKPRLDPKFISEDEQKNKIRETLWLLTACQTSHESKRIFNVEAIINRALDNLTYLPLSDVLQHFTDMYRSFDRDQKIVANFIASQLIYYNAINHVVSSSNMDATSLKLFCDLNVHKRYGLGVLGNDINRLLLKIHQLSNQQPLIRNFYILNQQVNLPELIASNIPFNQVFDRALTKTRGERIDDVLLIAHELRMLTLWFYQRVFVEEFWNSSWTKQDKKHLSPHIVELTEFFNKLSDYFIAKIVSQPPSKVKNALQLCIEIAQALCPLKDEQYPDINHLMVIGNGVLNSTQISRLTNYFEELPPRYKHYLKEIAKIVSHQKNYVVMRELYQEVRSTLPYLGLLSRDMTFANDGNENNMIRAEACGEILKKIMEIKLLVNVERTNFQTDLPIFLKNYTLAPDDHLYNASRRLQPISTDVIHWNNTTEGMNANTDRLMNNYLPIDILPTFLVKKKACSPSHIPRALVKSAASRVKKLKKESEKSQTRTIEDITEETLALLNLVDKLKSVVAEICRINNTYYQSSSSSETKSVESYLMKLFKLTELLESIKIIEPAEAPEPDEKSETAVRTNSTRRRATSLLGRYGIYKDRDRIISDASHAASSSTTPLAIPCEESGSQTGLSWS